MNYDLKDKFLKNLKEPFYPIIHRGSHAEICPICYGKGYIVKNKNKWIPANVKPEKKTCHGCGGKGWVTVND